MTQWYYSDYQRNRLGPVSTTDLAGLHANGQLDPGTLVWREGMAQWQPLHTVIDEIAAAAPLASAPPGGRDPHASPASPYAPPTARLGESHVHRPGDEVVYAGFWKRVAASIIDTFALGIPVGIVASIIGLMFGGGTENPLDPTANLLNIALLALAFAWFHSMGSLMATPGKLAIGIKVVRSDGEPISFLRGIARYFGYLLSSLLLCLGLLMAAFTERKRALHDVLCDTVVVDKWAFTGQPERQRHELGTVTFVVLVLGGGLLLLGLFAIIGLAAMLAGVG